MDKERITVESIPVIPKEGELGVTVNRVKTSIFYIKGRGYFLGVCPLQVNAAGYETFIVTSMKSKLVTEGKRFSRKELERLAIGIHESPIYNMLIGEVMERERLERLVEVLPVSLVEEGEKLLNKIVEEEKTKEVA